MNIYYLFDENIRKQKNDNNQNYWSCIIPDMLDRLGVKGQALSPIQLASTTLKSDDFLILGSDGPEESCKSAIEAGIKQGCTVVGLGTINADNLFGIQTVGLIAQAEDIYSLTGYFSVKEELLNKYLPVNKTDFVLPVFAPINEVMATSAQVIASINENGRDIIGLVKANDNNAYYFTFDLCQTILASQQGQPGTLGDQGWWRRIADMRILPKDYNTQIAYNDYYLYILQSLIAEKGCPMIHRLPPAKDGSVPDFILYYQGDEDSTHNIEKASEVMSKRGLPYQINIMPDPDSAKFVMTKEEYKRIKDRGHFIGVHDYFFGDWAHFSLEGFKYHNDLFEETYGEKPVTGSPHAGFLTGWAEIARYQAQVGLKAQNWWSAEITPEDDINAFNLCGYAFGSAYPFFFYDDAEHSNSKIPLVSITASYYEPRWGEGYEDGDKKIHDYLDDSAYFGRTSVFFLHPHYLIPDMGYNAQLTHDALDEVERYCLEKGYNTIRFASQEVSLWWHDRAASCINDISSDSDQINFSVTTSGEKGMIVKIPYNKFKYVSAEVKVNGQKINSCIKTVDGMKWIMVPIIKEGTHLITVKFK